MSKVQRGRENYERNRSQKDAQSNNQTNSEESEQTHVHEFLASTKLAEEGEDRHNHRFAGVTSEVIPKGDSHVHVILTNTDFLDHHHEVGIQTGPAIPVGNGKHVHFVKGITTLDDGHVHELEFATLIEKPLV
ncbi:YmaF family protein [Bacillus sp. sid0103]|uniref:YmaF family protein n=1 Tax=Bacillus sp. sid0103 TaxID=2856337 RepID=UPI001C471F10|nr:YmaF family protein [Bacillus sp. sid0103]MBV7509361.1 YmaF family protein [Bacillus sp. sid0103]